MAIPKPVSDQIFEKILAAMRRIEADPELRRTKRQIEQIAGVSHDAVARAFRQDATNDGKPWGLNERYARLSAGTSARRSPQEAESHALQRQLNEKNQEIRRLNDALDAYAIALFAHTVNAEQERNRTVRQSQDPIPIGTNRPRRR
ncbi:hypothetical protein [Georgenia ruanii]|uniref:hypothetical protein n=1 Tax=Georgenia ruanii TaxID=348442 RepID=UPI001264A41E|nr:hypothetical protein [Georgenia ruanii]